MTPEAIIIDSFEEESISVPKGLKVLLSEFRLKYGCIFRSRKVWKTQGELVGRIEILSSHILPESAVDALTTRGVLCKREAGGSVRAGAYADVWEWRSDMPWTKQSNRIFRGERAADLWVSAAKPSLREMMTVMMLLKSGESITLSIRQDFPGTYYVYMELRPKKKENTSAMGDLVTSFRTLGTWNVQDGVFWHRYSLPDEEA